MSQTSNAGNLNDLSTVREYFSHNIRTSTAMVVATVMVFKCGLGDDIENMSDVISESAYFLDVYSKGMEIMFDFVLNVPITDEKEEIEPAKLINHFMAKVPITLSEQGINFAVELDNFKVNTKSHIFKNLIELILCEEARKSRGNIKITGKNGLYTIDKDSAFEVPEIYKLFTRLFKKLGIEFTYTDKQIKMRFE